MLAGHCFKVWIYEVRTQTNQAALYQRALKDFPKSFFFFVIKEFLSKSFSIVISERRSAQGKLFNLFFLTDIVCTFFLKMDVGMQRLNSQAQYPCFIPH